jgi:hypothetical protein
LQRRPVLTGLASRIPGQRAWSEWLRQQLPPMLGAHLVNVVPKALDPAGHNVELVVFADSAGWSARLRYALAALETEIRTHDAAVRRTRVRVSPPD